MKRNTTIIVLGLLFLTNIIVAYPSGVSGYTKKTNANGCKSCHGALSSLINVDISGPTTLKPNETGVYKVTISGGSGTKVGVDIAVSSGVLTTYDSNLKVLNGELTQPSPKSYSGGKYIFTFNYKAPADTGYQILYATGESKKAEWNFANNFSVHVIQPSINAPSNLSAEFIIAPVPHVTLNWVDNADNETNYIVERSINTNTAFEQICELPANSVSYIDSLGLLQNANHFYRVYAKNAMLNSNYSNVVEIFNSLPVELTSFSAKQDKNNVLLSWTTASELNNMGFEVERALTKDNWQVIGFINGASTTTQLTRYSYVDENIKSDNKTIYYRLKQIDYNGDFEYYSTINLDFITSDFSFKLNQNFPNPFNPATTISFQLPAKLFTTLKIFDLTGKEVTTLINSEMEAGNYNINFNADNLSSGTYFYTLHAGDFTQTFKMQLIK